MKGSVSKWDSRQKLKHDAKGRPAKSQSMSWRKRRIRRKNRTNSRMERWRILKRPLSPKGASEKKKRLLHYPVKQKERLLLQRQETSKVRNTTPDGAESFA